MVTSSQTGSRDLALAFEDARLKFVLSVAIDHVDQVGYQLGGLALGLDTPPLRSAPWQPAQPYLR
jgi:hypothetical protein